MVNVDIEHELYEEIKEAVQKLKFDYPSIKFFVQKAVQQEIRNSKGLITPLPAEEGEEQ